MQRPSRETETTVGLFPRSVGPALAKGDGVASPNQGRAIPTNVTRVPKCIRPIENPGPATLTETEAGAVPPSAATPQPPPTLAASSAALGPPNKADHSVKIKGRWSEQEDEILWKLVKKYGTKKWRLIASHLRGRLPKQCRERWCNQLDPNIRKDNLTESEWDTVKKFHGKHGNAWAMISNHVPGRTANHIKNQWNTMVRRSTLNVSPSVDKSGEPLSSRGHERDAQKQEDGEKATTSDRAAFPTSPARHATDDPSSEFAAAYEKPTIPPNTFALRPSAPMPCFAHLFPTLATVPPYDSDHSTNGAFGAVGMSRYTPPTPSSSSSDSSGSLNYQPFFALVDASCELLKQHGEDSRSLDGPSNSGHLNSSSSISSGSGVSLTRPMRMDPLPHCDLTLGYVYLPSDASTQLQTADHDPATNLFVLSAPPTAQPMPYGSAAERLNPHRDMSAVMAPNFCIPCMRPVAYPYSKTDIQAVKPMLPIHSRSGGDAANAHQWPTAAI